MNLTEINLLPIRSKRISLVPTKGDRKAWYYVYIRLAVLIFLILALIGLIIARQRGTDPLSSVFPSPEYGIYESTEAVDLELLFELRDKLQGTLSTTTPAEMIEDSTATSTPTTTDEVIEDIEDESDLGEVIKVKIRQTSLGYLNVRQGPGTNFTKITQILPGEEYVLLEEDDDWIKLQLTDESVGWVYSIYVDKLE